MEHDEFIVGQLKRAREERGMPSSELARRADIPVDQLWSVLRGSRALKADELVRLALVLDMDFGSFVPEDLAKRSLAERKEVAERYGRGVTGRRFGR